MEAAALQAPATAPGWTVAGASGSGQSRAYSHPERRGRGQRRRPLRVRPCLVHAHPHVRLHADQGGEASRAPDPHHPRSAHAPGAHGSSSGAEIQQGQHRGQGAGDEGRVPSVPAATGEEKAERALGERVLTALFTSIRLPHRWISIARSSGTCSGSLLARTNRYLGNVAPVERGRNAKNVWKGVGWKGRDERYQDNLADPGSPAVTIPNYSNYLREKRSHADVAVIIIGDQLSKHNENHRTRYTSVGNLKSILLQLGNHLQH